MHVHTDVAACAGCAIANPSIPAASFCFVSTCVDNLTPTKCSDLAVVDQAGCNLSNSSGPAAVWFFVDKVGLANVCPPNDVCRNFTCDDTSSLCLMTPKSCVPRNLCETASYSVAAGGCVYTPKPCPLNDFCTSYACDVASGACVATSNACSDSDKCTVDSCAGSSCVQVPLNPVQLAVTCHAVQCKSVTCLANSCVYTNDFSACSACKTFNPSVPAATFCRRPVCVDANSTTSCSSLNATQSAACFAAVGSNGGTGFYVGEIPLSPGPCQADDFCTSYACQESSSQCIATPTPCSPSSQCETVSCDVAGGSCVAANFNRF